MLHCTSLQKPNAHSALHCMMVVSSQHPVGGRVRLSASSAAVPGGGCSSPPSLLSPAVMMTGPLRPGEENRPGVTRGWGRGTERERRHESGVRRVMTRGEGHDYPGRWRHPGSSGDQTSTDSIRGHTTGHTLTNIMRKSFIIIHSKCLHIDIDL